MRLSVPALPSPAHRTTNHLPVSPKHLQQWPAFAPKDSLGPSNPILPFAYLLF